MGISSGTMGALSLGAQIGGGVGSTLGSYFGARGQRNAALSQADVARQNARLAELNAQSELAKGNDAVARQTLRAGALKGQQRSSLAANGVDLGVGSAAELLASTDVLKEIDVNTLISNAVNKAWGYRLEGANYMAQAEMAKGAAKGISPGLAAASTLLSSAGSVASSWLAMKDAGVFDGDEENSGERQKPRKSGGSGRLYKFGNSKGAKFPPVMKSGFNLPSNARPRIKQGSGYDGQSYYDFLWG